MRRAVPAVLALQVLLLGGCGEPVATGGRPVAATLVPAETGALAIGVSVCRAL